jgi:hypothetical protein
MCSSLVLKRTGKRICFGYGNCWEVFSNQMINRVANWMSDSGITHCRPRCLVKRK